MERYGIDSEARKELDRANSALRQSSLPFDQEESEEPADTVEFRAEDVTPDQTARMRNVRKAEIDELFAGKALATA